MSYINISYKGVIEKKRENRFFKENLTTTTTTNVSFLFVYLFNV